MPFRRRCLDTKLHIIKGFYLTLELSLRGGGVDPGCRIAPELRRELVSANRRAVLCRSSHPLASATSLAQLCKAHWATASITAKAGDEIGVILAQNKPAPPKLVLHSQSALTLMTCLLHSDLLAMAPVQWNEAALTHGLLATIPVVEELSALPVVAIMPADLPLTPAATHRLDLLKRGLVLRASARGAKRAA